MATSGEATEALQSALASDLTSVQFSGVKMRSELSRCVAVRCRESSHLCPVPGVSASGVFCCPPPLSLPLSLPTALPLPLFHRPLLQVALGKGT